LYYRWIIPPTGGNIDLLLVRVLFHDVLDGFA